MLMSSILICHHMDHSNLLPLLICKSHSDSEKTCSCHLLHCPFSCSFPAHMYHVIKTPTYSHGNQLCPLWYTLLYRLFRQ